MTHCRARVVLSYGNADEPTPVTVEVTCARADLAAHVANIVRNYYGTRNFGNPESEPEAVITRERMFWDFCRDFFCLPRRQ